MRNRDRLIGIGEPVLPRYERIAFEKSLDRAAGPAAGRLRLPGHPLLDATLDLTLERHRDLLRRGTVLVDERDPGTDAARALLPGARHPGRQRSRDRASGASSPSGCSTWRSTPTGNARHLHYAPYLDYRPLAADEPGVDAIVGPPGVRLDQPRPGAEGAGHAIADVVPEHLEEVRDRRSSSWIDKTRAAVKDRLTKEISYWDHRAEELKLQEQAGKAERPAQLQEARKRADDLQARLQKRMEELKLEAQISPLPPVVARRLAGRAGRADCRR